MSKANYLRYLDAVAAGDQYASLDDYGAKPLGQLQNVTDIKPDWAASLARIIRQG